MAKVPKKLGHAEGGRHVPDLAKLLDAVADDLTELRDKMLTLLMKMDEDGGITDTDYYGQGDEFTLFLDTPSGGTFLLGVDEDMKQFDHDATASVIQTSLREIDGFEEVEVSDNTDFDIVFGVDAGETGLTADLSELADAAGAELTIDEEFSLGSAHPSAMELKKSDS